MTEDPGAAYTKPADGWASRAAWRATRLTLLGLPGAAVTTLACYGAVAIAHRLADVAALTLSGAISGVSVAVLAPFLLYCCVALAAEAGESGRLVLLPRTFPPLDFAPVMMIPGIVVGATVLATHFWLEAASGASLEATRAAAPAVPIGVAAAICAPFLAWGGFRVARGRLTGVDMPLDSLDARSVARLKRAKTQVELPMFLGGLIVHGTLVFAFRPLTVAAPAYFLWCACFVLCLLREMQEGAGTGERAPATTKTE